MTLQSVSKEKNCTSHVFSASLNKVSFQALPVKATLAWQQNRHQRTINIFKREVLERTSTSFPITVLVNRQYFGHSNFCRRPYPKRCYFPCMLKSHQLRNTIIFSKSADRQLSYRNTEN